MSLSHVSTARGYLKGMHKIDHYYFDLKIWYKKQKAKNVVGQARGICPLAV